MFDTCEFTFAGRSSSEFGLIVCDVGENRQEAVAFGNRASIVSSRSTGRIQPVHYGVNYHEEPLEFSLVFGSDHDLDRYEMEEISYWLTGHQDYQWLTIDQPDLRHVMFRCLISDLTPIFNGWLPVAFQATVTCDCPYAYGHQFESSYSVNGTTEILFRNHGSVREYLKPVLEIATAGGSEFSIINHNDNDREFAFTGLPASGLTITVDNNSGIITESTGSYNLYPYFNMRFFRLVHGDNHLELSGNAAVKISGWFLHNVAG